ncbi:MAG: hypothetical protein F6K41_34315 [Symploca sp. SIO3E6]|nr:hypothetical protein [Caldora sp. SIO3E6]
MVSTSLLEAPSLQERGCLYHVRLITYDKNFDPSPRPRVPASPRQP